MEPADRSRKEDDVEKRDLRSVLSFFAEIASSMRQEEGMMMPDDAEAGPEPQQPREESWAQSNAQ
jgi:hypothetical protein